MPVGPQYSSEFGNTSGSMNGLQVWPAPNWPELAVGVPQPEGRLALVHAGAEQLELEGRLQLAERGGRRRRARRGGSAARRRTCCGLAELVLERRQLRDPHRVEPVRVDLLEVVARCRASQSRRSRGSASAAPPCGLGRLAGVRVAAERGRNVGDGALRPHAVAGVIERRRDDGDAELAGRHGDDAAADAALGRQARCDTATCPSRRTVRRWTSPRGRWGPWPRPAPACRSPDSCRPLASVAAIVARSFALTPIEHCRV